MSVERIREEFCLLWSRLGPFWGVPPATSRVCAFLLSRASPADADEIVEALEMSRGGVSMACRELVDWGLVHVEKHAGTRRMTYRAEDDPEKVIRAIIATRKRREWDPILDSVSTWNQELAKERSADAKALRARLTDIESLVRMIDDTAESFLRGGTISKLGLKAMVKAARLRGTGKRAR